MAKKKSKAPEVDPIVTDPTPEVETTPSHPYLSEDVAAVYDLNWSGGHTMMAGKHGQIDLRTLTLERADKLFKAKWPLLKKKV